MIVSIIVTLAAAQSGFSPLPPSHQFFSGEALAYANRPSRYAYVVWPGADATTATHDLVPAAVWEDRDLWLRRVLKPEWIPSDLRARTIAFRQYRGYDTLALRYRRDGYDVQIMDLAGLVTVAVRGSQSVSFPASIASADALVKGVIERFLNLSTSELANLAISGVFPTNPPDTVYSFTVRSSVGYQFLPPWWMAKGFTDGHTVYLSMNKSLDEHLTFGGQQASTGNTGIRFLPGG